MAPRSCRRTDIVIEGYSDEFPGPFIRIMISQSRSLAVRNLTASMFQLDPECYWIGCLGKHSAWRRWPRNVGWSGYRNCAAEMTERRYLAPAHRSAETVTVISVPSPGALQHSKWAPIFCDRSRIPTKPQRRFPGTLFSDAGSIPFHRRGNGA